MLTTLTTLKSRLSILDSETLYDALLTSAIKAISARFDKECRRTLARTANATFEFHAGQTEICVPCYPIETVIGFEVKSNGALGWIEQPDVTCLIRHGCVISLYSAFSIQPSAFSQARVVYTGGYVLPGASPGFGQTPLPQDLEQAAIEQLAYWFQTRDRIGRRITWPSGGTYEQFIAQDLLQTVSATLNRHKRYAL